MHTQEIKYTDLDGNEQVRKFQFHIGKREALELELKTGGIQQWIETIQNSNDNYEIYNEFKKILVMAYGVKSSNGQSFDKSEAVKREFEGSPALDELIFGFMSGEIDAAAFINALFPANILKEAQAEAAKKAEQESQKPSETVEGQVLADVREQVGSTPPAEPEKKAKDYTRAELLEMPAEKFWALVGEDPRKMEGEHVLQVAMQRKSSGA